jgi:6-phosphogluconate dehydrogenase
MVPHQTVDTVLSEIEQYLTPSDTIIEGGNSYYLDTIRRNLSFEKRGIHFIDAGVSGGPMGALHGACIMVGGKKEIVSTYETLFTDLTVRGGYAYVGESGAGHFVKMVHNGIEYGMMQALAEGFDLIRNAGFSQPLPLVTIANLYNHGSVIESRLVNWLSSGLNKYGENLEDVSGSAEASGEGSWTVQTAKEKGVPVVVIEDSVTARTRSLKEPSYQGKLISVLRNQFGGHDIHTKHHD